MGTGGARSGAGRPAYRAKAEQLQRVDVREWARRGYLRDQCSFSWSWHRGDEPTGSIGVRVHGADSLSLQYMLGSDGDRRDGSQTIRLAHTPCNFGNARPWFVCPACQRRAGLLFMRWGRFACRQCQKVAYASQSCDLLDRLWRKQAKIETRLDAHWQRPKGMRRRTHAQLMDVLVACEVRREEAFARFAARMLSLNY